MTAAKHFHTVIVGAGPGGLACAALLAEKGIRVLVLERSRRIGPKVCAGGVTWSGLGRHLPAELIERPFTRQVVRSGLQQAVISASTPIISTINRERLGRWMAENAVQAGAEVRTGTPVTAITDKELITPTGRFSYDFLVGADGSSSLVRRFLKIPATGIGAGIHYQVPGNFEEMVWQLDPGQFATGYGWIFPHQNWASVGAYASRRDLAPALLKEKLHQWMIQHGIKWQGLKPQAASINFDYRGHHFGNCFLVGDAAGLASGLTGEGIYPAICSGQSVARTIIDPAHQDARLARLVAKQQRHCRLLRLCGRNNRLARIVIESLVAALRLGMIHFSALEMGNE